MPRLNQLIHRYINEVEEKEGEGLYNKGTGTPRFVLNLIDYLYYLRDDNTNFDFRYYNSVEHHLPQSRERYSDADSETLNSIGNLFLLSRRVNSSLNDQDPIAKVQKSKSALNTFPPNRKLIYERTLENPIGWTLKDIKKHEKEIRELFAMKAKLLEVKDLEDGPILYRACLAVGDYCEVNCGWSKFGERYDFSDLSREKARANLKTVTQWLSDNPGKELKDFIEYRLQTDELKKDSWRWCFVNYPSVVEFCREGNFTYNLKGRQVYLLPAKRVVNEARELHCHLFKEKSKIDDIEIQVNQEGVWISLEKTALVRLFPDAQMWLHLWADTTSCKWCYEIWSKRAPHAKENIELVKRGWKKNDRAGYYQPSRPFLCDCPDDYEDAVNQALGCYNEIIEMVN